MAQPSLWGNALQDAFANPMTLGGLSLLSGGDLNSGIRSGAALQQQVQQQRQQQAMRQGLFGLPNLTDNDKQILGNSPDLANEVLSSIYKNRFDPNAGLEAEYKRAQIGKLKAETADAGSSYGKTGTVVQGSDGKYYSVQFGSHGQRQILPLELGGGAGQPGAEAQPNVSLAPQRGVEVVGDTIIDKATGAPVRNVAGNIAGGKTAEVVGRETGEGQMNLPKAKMALDQSKVQDEVVGSDIDKAIRNSNAYTAGFWGSVSGAIPGTAAHDLQSTLTTIKGNIGFDKLQDMRMNSPTGGALGNVSNMEVSTLQSVWGALEQSQTPQQLRYNLNRLKETRQKFSRMRQQAYESDVKRFGKENVPDPQSGKLPSRSAPVQNGNYRFNPQTGKLEPME